MKLSPLQETMVHRGIAKGMSLAQIHRDKDYIQAGRDHAKMVYDRKTSWSAAQFLQGNDGPFLTVEEREQAYGQKVQDPFSGIWKDLAGVNPEYEKALRHKTAQTSNHIMGVQEAPMPLTPAALLRAAQEDAYHARKEQLFTLSNSPDKVVATQARLDILTMAQDPTFQELESNIDPDPRPYETYLRSQPGGVKIQWGGGTQAEREAYANAENRRNAEGPGSEINSVEDLTL